MDSMLSILHALSCIPSLCTTDGLMGSPYGYRHDGDGRNVRNHRDDAI